MLRSPPCQHGISNHSMVFAYRKLSINGVTPGHNTLIYRKFCKFNRTNFRNDIASQNWDEINNFSNPNDMWSKWKCMFLSIVDKHAPLRMRVCARSSPWITSKLKKRMHNRNILKIKSIKSKDPFDWMQFKKQRNIVNDEIRLAKQSYYHNSSHECKVNSRKTINELTSRKSGKESITSLKVNGVSITNPTMLSNEFNTHFATIGSKLAGNISTSDST